MNDQRPDYLNRALFFFFALFIFSSTFSIALAQSSLGVSTLIFIIVLIRDRYNPFGSPLKKIYLAIGAYVAWLIISSLAGPTPLDSLSHIREEWLWIAIPIAVYLTRKSGQQEQLVYWLAGGVLLISMYGVLQHFTGVLFFKQGITAVPAPDFGYMVQGSFSHRLTFGNYFGTAAMFLLGFAIAIPRIRSKRRNLVILLISFLAMTVTALAYSRGPLLSLSAVVLIAGFLINRRLLRITVPIVMVGAIVVALFLPGVLAGFGEKISRDMGGEYVGGRMFIWKNSAEIALENPILGVGPGNFKNAYEQQIGPDMPDIRKLSHAHNDVLNIAATTGFPGALLFLLIWVSMVSSLWKSLKLAEKGKNDYLFLSGAILGSIFFFLASISEAAFADEEIRHILMIVWGLGLGAVTNIRELVTPFEGKKA